MSRILKTHMMLASTDEATPIAPLCRVTNGDDRRDAEDTKAEQTAAPHQRSADVSPFSLDFSFLRVGLIQLSSGKRSVTAWRPSVRLSRPSAHTQCDSRRGQRRFRYEYYEDA